MVAEPTTTLCATLQATLAGYPGLSVRQAGDVVLIEGIFDVRCGDAVIDTFLISIEVDGEYPKKQPVCREVGGRIPATAEHHMNANGTMCLGVPEDIWSRMQGTFEINSFIESCLRPFLIGASCKLRGEPWPFGERAHGAAGIVEFYGERLGTLDESRVLDIIAMVSAPHVRGHWQCPCGSGRVLRRCHQAELLELRERAIPRQLLEASAAYVAQIVRQRADRQIAEMQRLVATMKRIEKNLKAA